MAKKKLGYVDLEWTCPSCGARNAGTIAKCENCGAPMPDDVDFDLPAAQEIDTSAETAAAASAGPDISCPYCGTRNKATAEVCRNCGGDLSEGARREAGRVVGALHTGPVPEVNCPHCGASVPVSNTKCPQCGGALAREKAPAEPEPAQETEGGATFRVGRGCIFAGLAIVVAIVAFMVWMSKGNQASQGVVQEVAWTYAIQVEALSPVEYKDWKDQVPAEAQLGKCTRKVRSIEQEPVAGATEVCGTPYVVDTGTGVGEVQQDCEYHVTDDWCIYTQMEWKPAGEITEEGSDANPRWPDLQLDSSQREAGREERYRVVFLVEDRERTYRPGSLEEFSRFVPGTLWVVETNRLGGVTSVQAAD